MNEPFFPIQRLTLFTTHGQIYRAFNHLVAARMGTLLLVPMQLVSGSCETVLDGCPVPWEEVHAVLEYPSRHPANNPTVAGKVNDFVQQIQYLGIDPDICEFDYISPMVNGKEKVLRMVHPCGVRYAVAVK